MTSAFAVRAATILAGALTLGALTPAYATEPTNGNSVSEMPMQATAKKADRKYCMKADMTGSRLRKTICKTRDGWLDQGVDPLHAAQ